MCEIVLGPKIPKFRILRWLLTWHRASENFDCYLKMGNANFVYKHFLKPAQGEMSSLSLLKAKNEEKVQKNLGFLDQVKNQFAHFGSPQQKF